MKRPIVASSAGTTAKPPPKRSRKKQTTSYIFSPDEAPTTDDHTIQVVTVSARRTGRFGVKNSTINVQKPVEPALQPPETPEIPTEDPDALDAREWHDMLGDDVIQTFKQKRKQRNDSVS
jgi:hypothetical protein